MERLQSAMAVIPKVPASGQSLLLPFTEPTPFGLPDWICRTHQCRKCRNPVANMRTPIITVGGI